MRPHADLRRETTLRALLHAAGAGDRTAFRQLFHEAKDAVHRVAWTVLRDRQAAEEVVGETFERIWLAAASYRAERGRPLGWMLTIARRIALDHLRRSSLRERAASDEDLASVPSRLPDPAEASAAEEGRARLCAALARLPFEERRCLDAAFLAGLSYAQAAEALGQPLGTVKTRIRRALRTLRAQLAESPVPHQESHP